MLAQHVLPLRDPGHRLDVDGMHGKDKRGQQSPRTSNRKQQSPEENDIQGRVQQNVIDVIAQRRLATTTIRSRRR